MIKFFRKIRQNLLNEGKTSKYFKYAIGEIVLVVIGILIALQINNWNENRKEYQNLKNSLVLMMDELNQDILFYNKHLENDTPRLVFLTALSNRKYKGLKLEDTSYFLAKNFDTRNFGSSYYSLKNNNKLNLIKDEKLKKEMVEYYEVSSNHYNDLSDWHKKFVMNNIESFILDNLPIDINAGVKPSSVMNSMEDEKLPSLVNFQIATIKRIQKTMESNIKSSKALITELKELLKG